MYFHLLRIKHWIKNLFLFTAPFFGGKIFVHETLVMAVPVFTSFSLCASAGYVLNDILDYERDRLHPKKRNRPLASGRVVRSKALIMGSILLVTGFLVAYSISVQFLFLIGIYIVIQLVYSLYLRSIPVVDIFCIASGFVIRVLAGGAAFHIPISQWLILSMFMISLVLASGKRIGEVDILAERAADHRQSLYHGATATLHQVLLITSSAALMSYALYTMEQHNKLFYTIPIVTLGLFRYLMLSKRGLGDPIDALSSDKLLAVTVVAWILLAGIIHYN